MSLDVDILHDGIAHIRQIYKWDCGIACLKMAILTSPEPSHLLWKRFDEAWLSIHDNVSTNFGKRPWTIDICNILNHLNIKFTYFTTSTEVSKVLSTLRFYSGTLKKDNKRVNSLLNNPILRQHIIKTSVKYENLTDLLKFGPLIILVDAAKLNCQICSKKNKFGSETSLWSPLFPKFTGHYITVIGYVFSSKLFYFRNPALSNQLCVIHANDLDKARFSPGTDEDIIAVNVEKRFILSKMENIN